MILVAAFVSGLVFSLGLAISGMTQPARVLAFLDVTGGWDPSMMFVMVGAIGVHTTLYRLIMRRQRPLFADGFQVPKKTNIDKPLVIGASIFGIGWGLGGVCIGPSVVALVSGLAPYFVFFAAVLAGMALHRVYERAATPK